MSGNYHPTPSPRSPWSSPVVIGAIVAGVLLLALAILLGFLLIPSDDETSEADQTTSASLQVSTRTVTATPSTVTSISTPPTTTPPPVIAGPQPDVPGTDQQGFIGGPRCNAAGDGVVMVGQTAQSKVVVCQVGDQIGQYYYKGLARGLGLEIGFPTRSGTDFTAVNGDTIYQMTPSSLTITTNGAVITMEPMLDYWTS